MKTKFRIPRLFKPRQNRLRVTVARRPVRVAATAREYDELAEPNMKLSRALLIVLLLHVVAVSGIIAFNAIKTRQGPALSVTAPATQTENSTAAPAGKPAGSTAQKTNAKSPTKEKADRAKQNEIARGALDSGKVYTVAKGDNPVTIAKKFKVSYDDLVALNHIDDPHKLQIGQKLLIPTRATKAKKNDE
jgi:LysM repeat protein